MIFLDMLAADFSPTSDFLIMETRKKYCHLMEDISYTLISLNMNAACFWTISFMLYQMFL